MHSYEKKAHLGISFCSCKLMAVLQKTSKEILTPLEIMYTSLSLTFQDEKLLMIDLFIYFRFVLEEDNAEEATGRQRAVPGCLREPCPVVSTNHRHTQL